jgi:hypothetical protein
VFGKKRQSRSHDSDDQTEGEKREIVSGNLSFLVKVHHTALHTSVHYTMQPVIIPPGTKSLQKGFPDQADFTIFRE